MKNKKVVEKYYEAFNKQKWTEMMSYLDKNVRHDINQGECEVGLAKFKKFLAGMDAHYSEQVKHLVVLDTPKADRVAAEFYIDGVYKKTQKGLPKAKNQKYYIRVGAFFELKKSKITRVTNYYNLNDWIKCVK